MPRHGGEDPGAISGNLREKDFNLRAANYMYDRFKELGIPVSITRDTDETLTRNERISRMLSPFGNDSQVILLSNHINAGGGEGAEVVYSLRNNDTLAKSVLEEIGNRGQLTRKYYQRRLPENPSKDYYYIMRETPNISPLLIEYGFIDNVKDAKKLQNNLLDYVEGVVKAVANYTGYNYVAPNGITNNEDTYIVKSGDSLWKIANQYNTTVDELKKINNLTSNTLTIGQRLILPKKDNSNENINSNDTYIVKRGDTLYSIADQFNVLVSDIISLNNLTSNTLQVGQIIYIPKNNNQNQPTNNNYFNYTVIKGDSLWNISNKYDIPINELKNINNLTTNILQIGQILKIPQNNNTNQSPIENDNQNINEYIVISGDSLWKIANQFKTTVDDIISLNNLTSNTLQIGQILKIPTNSTYRTYYVKNGDTLWKIANEFNTTVNTLREINNLTSTVLKIGQEIKVPNN